MISKLLQPKPMVDEWLGSHRLRWLESTQHLSGEHRVSYRLWKMWGACRLGMAIPDFQDGIAQAAFLLRNRGREHSATKADDPRALLRRDDCF